MRKRLTKYQEFEIKRSARSRNSESRRFLTKFDMHEAKRADNIRNSQVKRGEGKHSGNSIHVACGCGASGCMFISPPLNKTK